MVLLLVNVGTQIAGAIHYDGVIDRAGRLSRVDPELVSLEHVGNVFTTVVGTVLVTLLAVLFAACLVPLRRGSNVARILILVAAGLILLACLGPVGAGALFLPIAFMASPFLAEEPWSDVSTPGETEALSREDAFYEALLDPATDLFHLGVGASAFIVFGLMVAVAVLVLLPSANRFFVPRPEVPALPWPMPMPMPMAGQVYYGHPGTHFPPAHPHPQGYPYVFVYPAGYWPAGVPGMPAGPQPDSVGPTDPSDSPWQPDPSDPPSQPEPAAPASGPDSSGSSSSGEASPPPSAS